MNNKIGNRVLYGGKLIRKPAFIEIKKRNSDEYRVSCETFASDQIMNHRFFLLLIPV